MSVINYEVKRKKLLKQQHSDVVTAGVSIFGVAFLMFLIFKGGFNHKLIFFLGLVILASLLYIIVLRQIYKKYESKSADLFNNELLVFIAKDLKLTFQPFGAFFLEDFGDFATFTKGANLSICRASMIGKIGFGNAKFGDLALKRDFKRKKKFFDLDKIFSRISENDIFNGFILKVDYLEPFLGRFEVGVRGDFFGNADLKFAKPSVILSEVFDIYADEKSLQIAPQIINKEILSDLQKVMENLIGKTMLYVNQKSLIISVENSELFKFNTNSHDSNSKLLESMKLMAKIAQKIDDNNANLKDAQPVPNITFIATNGEI